MLVWGFFFLYVNLALYISFSGRFKYNNIRLSYDQRNVVKTDKKFIIEIINECRQISKFTTKFA